MSPTMILQLDCGSICLFDEEDSEQVMLHRWRAQKSSKGAGVYALTSFGKRVVAMHRLILSPPAGALIDHINGNGLDNRRSNLRVCTHTENIRNRRKIAQAQSRFKGVRQSTNGDWRAEIQQNGQQLYLGTFKAEDRAARQYDRAARVLFGQFALTNEMLGLLP